MLNNGKAKPPLLALLICEQVLLDEAKVATLMRVVDTFNFEIGIERPESTSAEEGTMPAVAVPVKCVVFTRWGLGGGEFTEQLRLVTPNGEEVTPQQGVPFKKLGGFGFYQIRHQVDLGVTEPGIYAFRVYLDGILMGEHPFRVNIQKRFIQESTQEQQSRK